MPEINGRRQLSPNYQSASNDFEESEYDERQDFYQNLGNENARPIIIDQSKNTGGYENGEVEDTPLAMEDIEKEAIKRALNKYKGRRKEAAEELKISERTLYRKIKEYDL